MGNDYCFNFRRRRARAVEAKVLEPLLHQEEREAVDNLLKYYDEGSE